MDEILKTILWCGALSVVIISIVGIIMCFQDLPEIDNYYNQREERLNPSRLCHDEHIFPCVNTDLPIEYYMVMLNRSPANYTCNWSDSCYHEVRIDEVSYAQCIMKCNTTSATKAGE